MLEAYVKHWTSIGGGESFARGLRVAGLFALVGLTANAGAQPGSSSIDPEGLEFFEAKIRPVLVENCYGCHNSADRRESGLALDSREGLLRGGMSGPAIRPGNVRASRLIRAIRSTDPDLRMPFKEPRLESEVIADIEAWIEMGAPDPRDEPPSAEEIAASTSWETIRDRRLEWWSFQPIASPEPPPIEDSQWSRHPVDRFIRADLEAAGLEPAGLVDPAAFLRRLSFLITGLPPSPSEIDNFVAAAEEDRQAAVEAATDRYLESPEYGERWGRHWMDWIRYADSYGSEGDPRIPNAWRYRDYLIRALNADVPYDQLVREHLAGDLLPKPRIDDELGLNESTLGVAQYRFVIHGFGPTDALDELVRFTENQIDVVSKAFLGLTVACARCHNHKFDPISQSDFYALFGVMASSRPAMLSVDSEERQQAHKDELQALKPSIRAALAERWLAALPELAHFLLDPSEALQEAIDNATSDHDPLHPWLRLRNVPPEDFAATWSELRGFWNESRRALDDRTSADYERDWDLSGPDAKTWFRHGNGLASTPSPPGGFHILPEGDRAVDDIYPAGIYSHGLSSKHAAILTSPRFRAIAGDLYLRIAGGGQAAARYVVQNYPQRGEVFPIANLEDDPSERWYSWDLSYWEGDHLYVEMATAADQPLHAKTDVERSWFGISRAIVADVGQPPPRDEMAEFYGDLFVVDSTPQGPDDLAERYRVALRTAIEAWRDGGMSDSQARFLGTFVHHDLLPTSLADDTRLATLVAQYRDIEASVPIPTRAPGVLEGDAFDQPLFLRGNHKQPGPPVPRRFLEAIDDAPYSAPDSGRLALAESILHPDNPLAARVIVNRLWHYLYGHGLVTTTDNFGKMGEQPSHPELLDYLARRFVTEGWSLKTMIRFLATTRTLQLESIAGPRAADRDPANRLLSHSNPRRLEAEAIRDSMLSVAGRLDASRFGPSVMGSSNRRSVYVSVYRNSLEPFLDTFDAPDPVSTKGRRDTTNVPAHSLTLMNDPFVLALARDFADRVTAETEVGAERVERMFRYALGRRASAEETQLALDFVEAAKTQEPSQDEADHPRQAVLEREEQITERIAILRKRLSGLYVSKPERRPAFLDEGFEPEEITEAWIEEALPYEWLRVTQLRAERDQYQLLAAPADGWDQLAHAVFNMKEFIYVR